MLQCSIRPARQSAATRRKTRHGGRVPAQQEMTMDQVTKPLEAFSRAARDAAEFGRGNIEAVTRSAQAYFQGTQELGRQALASAQELNAQAIEAAKALAGMKSLKKAAEIQTLFVRAAF